jgi:hypothetical protein
LAIVAVENLASLLFSKMKYSKCQLIINYLLDS